jgi:hypothetical protein
MCDIVVLGSASSEMGGGETMPRRRASASAICHEVGEGAIADTCRPTSEQVICDALHLALVATHLRVVWHARAITAEGAIQLLDQAFRQIRVRNEEEARYRR